jgi:hypothetical protein
VNLSTLIALISVLALGACQSSHDLAVANGPVFALNPGRWQPTAQDLKLTDSKQGALPVAPPVVDRAPTPVTLSAAGTQRTSQEFPTEMLR